jgi:hypothetical protein
MAQAAQWLEPQAPFSSRDCEGLKSEPEDGLTLSSEILQSLERFRGSLAAAAGEARRP